MVVLRVNSLSLSLTHTHTHTHTLKVFRMVTGKCVRQHCSYHKSLELGCPGEVKPTITLFDVGAQRSEFKDPFIWVPERPAVRSKRF